MERFFLKNCKFITKKTNKRKRENTEEKKKFCDDSCNNDVNMKKGA